MPGETLAKVEKPDVTNGEAATVNGTAATATAPNLAALAELQAQVPVVGELYEGREFGKALREVMALADRVNEYVEQHKPWNLAKAEGAELELHQTCSTGIEAFRVLTILLAPVLPKVAEQVARFLQVPDFTWADATTPLGDHAIGRYAHLMQRIDPDVLAELFAPAGAVAAEDDRIVVAVCHPLEGGERVVEVRGRGDVGHVPVATVVLVDLASDRAVRGGTRRAH